MKYIAVYGAGGFAREVGWLVESCAQAGEAYRQVCFIDDEESSHGELLNGIPIMGLLEARERFPEAFVVLAVGNPKNRQVLAEKVSSVGMRFETLIHPNVERSQWVEIGEGTIICAGNVITTNIRIGRHVQINLNCTIGHDAVLEDFATLAPGVHVSGYVHIGKRAYVGTGAVTVNGTEDERIVIGDDVVVGAGACVTKSVPPDVTVVGIPAKPIEKR